MHEAALFQNVFKFCTFLPKFSDILAFFALFLPVFWKIAHKPLHSRIAPGDMKQNTDVVSFIAFECNAKSFAVTCVFSLPLYPVSIIDWQKIFKCFIIFYLGGMWPGSELLIRHVMYFHVMCILVLYSQTVIADLSKSLWVCGVLLFNH